LLSRRDIGLGLVLLLAAVLELVSAFGPVVVRLYALTLAEPSHAKVAKPQFSGAPAITGGSIGVVIDQESIDQVLNYMAERLEPAPRASGVSTDELVADYQEWCHGVRVVALPPHAFLAEFDHARREHRLVEQMQKSGGGYYGIRFATRKIPRLARRTNY
jgi:hypothetical protein